MISDKHYRLYLRYRQTEATLRIAAAKAGIDEKTGRKYYREGKMPSEMKIEHTWRTREDPFSEDWAWVEEMLELKDLVLTLDEIADAAERASEVLIVIASKARA